MNEDNELSRKIPLPIQRQVRQRCGFGCIFCGLPLYEYDHILGWEKTKRHDADEITLLCDQHHREKTSGLLTTEQLIKANEKPYNLRNGVSKPYDLHYEGEICEIVIGSNTFRHRIDSENNCVYPIVIDDTVLVGFELIDNHLLFNLKLFDESNNLVMLIDRNQLIYSISPWDIQFIGKNLIIRENSREILVDILFEPPNTIIVNRGRFLFNGVQILINRTYLVIGNSESLFSGCTFFAPCGIMIGKNNIGIHVGVFIENLERYNTDNSKTLKWIKEVFGQDHP
jgi:hypothetical protein